MRVAAIDIGTNTVLLLVAEADPKSDGALVAIEERATITRLGQGVDKTRALAPDAIARTNACLTEYATAIRALGVDAARVGVVGTSAMRDAKGGEAVREHVRRELGVEARVISGDEEARLTFGGAVSGLGLDEGPVAVFDIGGGSTEVVVGKVGAHGEAGAITYAHSFDVGSVRITERHIANDPPTAAEIDAITRELARVFAAVPDAARTSRDGAGAGARSPVGIAGTMTTLAAVAMRMDPYDGARVHGYVMTVDELRRVVADLAALPIDARRALPGMEPKRADVIVAGGLIALALADRLDAREVRISDRGVRWGLAATLAHA
jgi:exopolyphosphatase/guanosine-5'-triphosphate,3'-diphosphate pyrophosphatase